MLPPMMESVGTQTVTTGLWSVPLCDSQLAKPAAPHLNKWPELCQASVSELRECMKPSRIESRQVQEDKLL